MKFIKIIIIIIFSVILSGSYYQENTENFLSSAKDSGFMDRLSDESIKALERIGIEGLDIDDLSSVSVKDIFEFTAENIAEKAKGPLYSVAAVISCILICALAGCFSDDIKFSEKTINAVCAAGSSAIFILPIKNVMLSSADVIKNCSDFMLGFIPVYSSAVAASGYVSSATGYNSLMLAAVTIISEIADGIIVPLMGIYLGICIAGSVSDMDMSELSKSVKTFAVWILGASMTVFSGIMGLGTLAASSADGAFSKTAKFLIGSAVPVIGGTVSDAMSTVKSCLHITKNMLGIYAVLAIAVIFIPPILSIAFWKMSLYASSIAGSFFGNRNLSSLLSSASSVLGIMLALVILTAVFFIFAVFIMLSLGGT